MKTPLAARNAALLVAIALAAAACARGDVAVPTSPGFSGTAGTLPGDPLAGGGALGGAGGVSYLPGSQVSDRVLFSVDEVTLNPQATAILDAQVGWLRANSSGPILIEGHADERGTSEYNMALGSARASAVRNYFVSQGISDSRLSIITYGRERPVATCPDESCWSQNRRAVTVVAGPGA